MSAHQGVRNVMIVGGGGNLGAIVLQALLKAHDFRVTVLARPSSTAVFPPDVGVIKTEYNPKALHAAFEGQHAVVSVVGATGFADQKLLIDAAVSAGVKRFLPSEFGPNTMSDAVRTVAPVFQPKMDIINYLKEKESLGLTWTGIGVGVLLDYTLKIGFLGFDLAKKSAQIWDGGSTKFSAIMSEDLGNAVVSTLRNPDRTANQYLHISALVTSQLEILKVLEKETGASWSVNEVTTADQVAEGNRLVSKGDFSGMLMLVQASLWGNLPGLRQDFERDEQLANSKVDLEKRSLDSAIKVAISLA